MVTVISAHQRGFERRPSTTRIPRVLIRAVLVAGLLDAATTFVGLQVGGHEANPVAAAAFQALGLGLALALRVIMPPVLFAFALRWTRRRDIRLFRATASAVMIAAALWTIAAVNNMVAIAIVS